MRLGDGCVKKAASDVIREAGYNVAEVYLIMLLKFVEHTRIIYLEGNGKGTNKLRHKFFLNIMIPQQRKVVIFRLKK